MRMRHLALSVTDQDGRQYCFDARVPENIAYIVASAVKRSGTAKVVECEGAIISACPLWAAGTPLQPVFSAISRLWYS